MRLSKKVESLMEITSINEQEDKAIADLKKNLSTLKKLYIIYKVGKDEREDGKTILNDIQQIRVKQVAVKDLKVPDHFICQVSGDLMREPVMLQSGQTYEKSFIEHFFERKKKQADQERIELSSSWDESKYSEYFRCPITQLEVDPKIMLPNMRIRLAIEHFLKENAWAYDFDPRQKYQSIKVVED